MTRSRSFEQFPEANPLSEYQFHEFQAVDKPFTERQQERDGAEEECS
jgi:hypothetical protein